MKLFSNKNLLVLLVVFSVYGYLIGCRKDNDLLVPIQTTKPFVPTRGNNIHLPGSMTKADSTQWKLDKVHSSSLWSAAYVGAAGLLTGRFNQFGMHDVSDPKALYYPGPSNVQPLMDSSWAFNESDPTKTYFNGYVQINTSNTGEPGRDAGCNISGMGTESIKKDTMNLTVINLAKIRSTKIELDPNSNDYIVTLDLTWHGKLATPVTKSIIGKLKYIPKAYVGTGVYPAQYAVFGLQLIFQFNCRDFGIVSTSIGDKIDIECNMNFNNK